MNVMSIIIFTLTLSLFDSLSTTQQIIIFILLLTTEKPLRNSIAYLAGLCGAYIVCGVAGYIAIERLQAFLSRYIPTTQNMSNDKYYQYQIISGVVMTVIGLWYYRKKRFAPPGHSSNFFISRLRTMNGIFAFCIGTFISITSFPVAVPYIIALGRYASAGLSVTTSIGNIVLYNFGYALPMLVILVIYLFARRDSEDLNDLLHEKARVLNVKLTTWAFAGIGIFSIVDALCYYITGHAVVKGRYF